MKDIAALKEKMIGEYLAVSGATAICIMQLPKGYGFTVGRRAVHLPNTITAHWVDHKVAAKIARLARRSTGRYPDKATAERELQRAASAHRAQLTPNMVVISRAKFMAQRVQEYLDVMDKSGGLTDFKKEYRRRRIAATMRGEGFMSYATSMLRLRRTVIRMLIDKQQIRQTPSFFDDIFERKI